jgi:hypothetical protein
MRIHESGASDHHYGMHQADDAFWRPVAGLVIALGVLVGLLAAVMVYVGPAAGAAGGCGGG